MAAWLILFLLAAELLAGAAIVRKRTDRRQRLGLSVTSIALAAGLTWWAISGNEVTAWWIVLLVLASAVVVSVLGTLVFVGTHRPLARVTMQTGARIFGAAIALVIVAAIFLILGVVLAVLDRRSATALFVAFAYATWFGGYALLTAQTTTLQPERRGQN
jgi:hypothetical protein